MSQATPRDVETVERENAYLKQRCSLLEDDVSDLGAQVTRLSQQLERLMARRDSRLNSTNPLSGGQ